MTSQRHTTTSTGSPPRTRWIGLATAAALIAGALFVLETLVPPAAPQPQGVSAAPVRHDRSDRALGPADGAIPDHTSVFDEQVTGVARLDDALLAAVRRAAVDADQEGVRFVVDSGWRSPAYQDHLRREAIATYGSEAEAARWVASPETSAHVSGDAIDLGPPSAAAWLGARGAAYGICQVYANEPWHFELRPDAVGQGCPVKYADPTHDPRLQP